MGILSEIFAELTGLSTVAKPQGGSSPRGKADPFKNTAKSKLAPKNVPISQQKTELEMHAQKQAIKQSSNEKYKSSEIEDVISKKAQKCQFSASAMSATEVRKAIIMSEILGKPKSRR